MGWFSKISGVFSFVLQAVVVIAAVLLFCYLDPFGLLNSKKKTLENTPVTISSIKEIGQLISAEYYGEVVSSLNEKYISELNDNSNQIKSIDTSVGMAMAEMHAAKLKFRKKKTLQQHFNENYINITGHPFYQYYVEYMCNIKNVANEKNLLDKLYDENYKPSIKKLDEKEFSRKSRDYFSVNKKSLQRQIVLIGRGSVQAGYDFDAFTERNFKYNPNTNTIYFIGLHPQILSCNINPWLIPERKVKGFEILVCTGKASKQEYMQLVKQDCLDKLRASALQQNILEKAQASARETLKNFFSLLLNNPVRDVIFLNHMSDYYEAEIASDGNVRDAEILLLDSVYHRIYTQQLPDTIGMADFIDSVKTLPLYIDNEKRQALNVFSSNEYTISKDWLIDSMEYVKLNYLKQVVQKQKPIPAEWNKYKAWYSIQPDTLIAAYKQTLNFLSAHTNRIAISSKENSKDSLLIQQKIKALQP